MTRRLHDLLALSARLSRRGDAGFSMIEVMVTMLIVTAIVPLAFGLLKSLVQQNDAARGSVLGVQLDQTASSALIRWLHGATVILPGSNATELQASILAGTNASSVPEGALLQAVLSSEPGGGGVFTTTVTPDGGAGRSVATQAVESNSVFTYYYNTAGTPGSTIAADTSPSLPPGLAATSSPTDAQLSQIVAVGIDATFLGGPQHVAGAPAAQPTTFETTVYLQNASGAPAPASATSIAFTGGATTGSPITATATISPLPNGGTVQFTSLYDGATSSPCAAPVDVSSSTGTASCSFTPAAPGVYTIDASFSGTSTLQPSTAQPVPVTVLSDSATTALATRGSSSGTMVVSATVTSNPPGGQAPTGTVAVSLTQTSGCSRSCPTTNTAGQLASSGTSASFSVSIAGLRSGAGYSVTVSYAGDSTYASSSAKTTGTAA